MRKLKKKFRKVLNKNPQKRIVLKKPKKLVPIKIKQKLGRWCNCYEGRLPYPVECSTNKIMPKVQVFKGKEVITFNDRSKCATCKRFPTFLSWKNGDWTAIIIAIENGEDLIDMPAPNQDIYS